MGAAGIGCGAAYPGRHDVEWPVGQDYPTSIFVDQDKMVADEEVTWVISDVQPA